MWYQLWRGLSLRRSFVLSAIVLAGSAMSVPGQTALTTPAPGTRLRVWSPDVREHSVVGALSAMDSVSLTLDRGDATRFVFPWTRVDSVQVSRGLYGGRARKGALVGALVGGGFLALVIGASAGEGDVIDPAAAAGVSFVVGGLGGALVGAMIGSARAQERWESMSVRPRVGARGVASGLQLSVAVVNRRFR